MKKLCEAFARYERLVIPKNAGPIQTQECQRAFYAGAAAMSNIVTEASAPNISKGQAEINIGRARYEIGLFLARTGKKSYRHFKEE